MIPISLGYVFWFCGTKLENVGR